MAVSSQSSPEAKISLFRSLFRGREEVYPRRFESRKSGRAGYQPACGNEWVRGICEKPRIKCSDCPHRRLETHPHLAGLFQLNAVLPIPFNDHSEMEVDFLCAPSRLVIELDGLQHLTDATAYRRDRRKDALLQIHGHLVLRFLTEDLGKNLDHVLDQILRTLAGRQR